MNKQKTVLVAEDESALSKTLNLKLSAAGFKVEMAQNGAEALSKIAAGGIDLLILDLVMPKMNGFEVLEELRRQKSTMPVVVATNLSQDSDAAKVAEYGVADYFVKSEISIKDLIDKIIKILA